MVLTPRRAAILRHRGRRVPAALGWRHPQADRARTAARPRPKARACRPVPRWRWQAARLHGSPRSGGRLGRRSGCACACWKLAHRREGRLPWAALMQPAIDLAPEQGFVVMSAAGRCRSPPMPDLKRDAGRARALLLRCRRRSRWQAGTIAHAIAPMPKTLPHRLQERGADAFYAGPIARAIMAEVNADLTEARHAAHGAPADLHRLSRPRTARRCARPYRGYERVQHAGPPTSGGIAMLQILGILQPLPAARCCRPTAPQALAPDRGSQPPRLRRSRPLCRRFDDFARVPIKMPCSIATIPQGARRT